MRVWVTVASLQGSAAVTFGLFSLPLEPFFVAPMGFKKGRIEGLLVRSDPLPDLCFEVADRGLDLRENLILSISVLST